MKGVLEEIQGQVILLFRVSSIRQVVFHWSGYLLSVRLSSVRSSSIGQVILFLLGHLLLVSRQVTFQWSGSLPLSSPKLNREPVEEWLNPQMPPDHRKCSWSPQNCGRMTKTPPNATQTMGSVPGVPQTGKAIISVVFHANNPLKYII